MTDKERISEIRSEASYWKERCQRWIAENGSGALIDQLSDIQKIEYGLAERDARIAKLEASLVECYKWATNPAITDKGALLGCIAQEVDGALKP